MTEKGLTTTQRGYGHAWRKKRAYILARDGRVCRWCGEAAGTVDHIVPKVLGGTDDESNLAAACARCNYARGGQVSRPSGRARATAAMTAAMTNASCVAHSPARTDCPHSRQW